LIDVAIQLDCRHGQRHISWTRRRAWKVQEIPQKCQQDGKGLGLATCEEDDRGKNRGTPPSRMQLSAQERIASIGDLRGTHCTQITRTEQPFRIGAKAHLAWAHLIRIHLRK
jgi:hypothetical protein